MELSKPKMIYLYFTAILTQIVFGLVPPAAKIVIEEIPVELYTALRLSLSAATFILCLLISRAWAMPKCRNLIYLCLLGIVGHAGGTLLTLYGMKKGGVANFALVASLTPVITTFVAVTMFNERPYRYFFLGLIISILGVLAVVAGKYQISSFDVAAESSVYILLGFFVDACVFLFSKRFRKEISTTGYLAITMLSAALMMWLLEVTWLHQLGSLSALSGKGTTLLGLISVIGGAACYFVFYWLLSYVEGHKLSLFFGFRTISTIAVGHALFNEQLTLSMILGGCLIFIAMVVGNLEKSNS